MSTDVPGSIAGSIRPEASVASSSAHAGGTHTPKLAGLIASRVYRSVARPAGNPGRAIADAIDLSSAAAASARSGPRALNGAIPFYTNPARANEVATEIALGRELDVKG